MKIWTRSLYRNFYLHFINHWAAGYIALYTDRQTHNHTTVYLAAHAQTRHNEAQFYGNLCRGFFLTRLYYRAWMHDLIIGTKCLGANYPDYMTTYIDQFHYTWNYILMHGCTCTHQCEQVLKSKQRKPQWIDTYSINAMHAHVQVPPCHIQSCLSTFAYTVKLIKRRGHATHTILTILRFIKLHNYVICRHSAHTFRPHVWLSLFIVYPASDKVCWVHA